MSHLQKLRSHHSNSKKYQVLPSPTSVKSSRKSNHQIVLKKTTYTLDTSQLANQGESAILTLTRLCIHHSWTTIESQSSSSNATTLREVCRRRKASSPSQSRQSWRHMKLKMQCLAQRTTTGARAECQRLSHSVMQHHTSAQASSHLDSKSMKSSKAARCISVAASSLKMPHSVMEILA